jgi:hypothetical protein
MVFVIGPLIKNRFAAQVFKKLKNNPASSSWVVLN